MNTKKNKLNSLLKIGLLFFGASILLWNCEKQNFEPGVQTSKSPFKQKFVTLSEIPRVKQLLPKKLKSIYQRKTVGLNDAIFDESNILEVIDTLNNANYSFSFLLPTAPKGQLFNLIIGKNAYGELNTPFVLKYTCEEAYVDEFIANNYDFGHFKGTISLHKYTDYFEKDYFSKTTNHDCTEFDQFGDPIPCDINPVDGTSTGGGPGVNPGGSGTGTTSGNPAGGGSGCTSTYSWWCAAGGTGPHSVESCGAGTGGILIIDISCAFQNKNTTDCPPCTTSIDGGIGINTISILTMRVTLKKVLNLRGAELAWVAKSDNNAAVKAIYTFLQRNEVDGVYFPEAVSFAEAAMETWMENKNTLVDFENQIIIEPSVPDCVKNIITKIGSDSVYLDLGDMPDFVKMELNLSGYIMDIFNNSSKYHLNFKVGTLASNKNAHTFFNIDTRAFDITLNTSYISNATDLAIARTIIHESLHAYIKLIYHTQVLSSLHESLDYLLSQNGDNPNTAQHILMTQQFLQGIANSLESWDNSSLTKNNYYNFLSWSGGMLATPAFNQLDINTQTDIINANINEGQANTAANNNAKGNKNCN